MSYGLTDTLKSCTRNFNFKKNAMQKSDVLASAPFLPCQRSKDVQIILNKTKNYFSEKLYCKNGL